MINDVILIPGSSHRRTTKGEWCRMEATKQPDLERTEAEIKVSELDSVAIQRLIAEVRSEEPVLAGGQYNRTYNRHNR
jgi:hypothetical protein